MKKLTFLILFIAQLSGCQMQAEKAPTRYSIDLKNAPETPALFGENIVATPLYERDLAIHPGLSEFIYTLGDYKQSRRALVSMKLKDGKWSGPKVLSISGRYQDIEPFYANNGERLYFASNRPIYNDTTRQDYNIWYTDRIDGTWSEPQALDSMINTRGNEYFPSISEKGNLFFTATREDGIGREDIFKATYDSGRFLPPKVLSEEINTPFYEFNAYVNPKENLIVFSSFGRQDGLGGGDLYMSRKDDEGNWSAARNLGVKVNSKGLDYNPFIDFENRILYFTSDRLPTDKKSLTSAGEIESLANNPLNGFGNIYHVSLDIIWE